MRSIAFFDFDGTITRKDTLLEIIRFHKGSNALYRGLLQIAPALFLYKIGLLPSHTMKQMAIRHFFSGMPEKQFREGCNAFCQEVLPGLIRPDALKAIHEHLRQGHEVAVVTASAGYWVAPWCDTLGIACIGTRLQLSGERLTGNLDGRNCNQEEKVLRIKEAYRLEDYEQIYAYGDTNGDKAMLGIATHPFYRKFH